MTKKSHFIFWIVTCSLFFGGASGAKAAEAASCSIEQNIQQQIFVLQKNLDNVILTKIQRTSRLAEIYYNSVLLFRNTYASKDHNPCIKSQWSLFQSEVVRKNEIGDAIKTALTGVDENFVYIQSAPITSDHGVGCYQYPNEPTTCFNINLERFCAHANASDFSLEDSLVAVFQSLLKDQASKKLSRKMQFSELKAEVERHPRGFQFQSRSVDWLLKPIMKKSLIKGISWLYSKTLTIDRKLQAFFFNSEKGAWKKESVYFDPQLVTHEFEAMERLQDVFNLLAEEDNFGKDLWKGHENLMIEEKIAALTEELQSLDLHKCDIL